MVRGQIGLVAVHTDRELPGLVGRLDDAEPRGAGRMIDDIAIVCRKHLFGDALALGRVCKALGVLGNDLDLFPEDPVGVGHTALIPALKLLDHIVGDPPDKADPAGLRDGRGNIAHHKGGFLAPEHDPGHVGRSVRKGIVHTGETDIRIESGRLQRRVRGGKADRPAQAVPVVDQIVEIVRKIRMLLGFNITDVRAGVLPQLLEALPGALVEGLVVDPAGVGHHGDLPSGTVHISHIQVHLLPAPGGAPAAPAGQFPRADKTAGSQRQDQDKAQGRCSPSDALFHIYPPY